MITFIIINDSHIIEDQAMTVLNVQVLNADENNVVVETVAAVDGDDHFLLHCY
jgi:hypothetical protein